MNKQAEIINELIKIANYLDERFCAEEADELTAVAQRLAQVAEVPWEDLDAPSRGPEWELGEDEYLREQDARSEIAQMEYDDAMRIVQELMPRIDSLSNEERAMLEEAQMIIDGSSSASNKLKTQDFAKALLDGGADVYDPFADE